jgi:hypothetical protein
VTEYVVKLAFWLRAWDSVTIEAEADAEAIDKAKAAAKRAMESRVIPESIDTDRRREGLIAWAAARFRETRGRNANQRARANDRQSG